MKAGEIFNYDSSRDILLRIFDEKQSKNPMYSIRSWSKRLGFRNPSFLSEILRGKKKLKPDLAMRIAESIVLAPNEIDYFKTLVYFENARNESEAEFFKCVLNKFRPQDKLILNFTHHPYELDWRCLILDELPCLKDFKPDFNYIAKRIGKGMTPQEAKLALKILTQNGILETDNRGKLSRSKKVHFLVKDIDENTIADTGKQVLMRECLNAAREAVGKQTLAESFFKTNTIPIKKRDIPRIKQFLLDCLFKADDFETSSGADEVYNLILCFYQISEEVK